MMIFFLSPNEQIYGRYGGRDSNNADSRQSMAGLRYAMQAALATHREQAKSPPKIDKQEPVTIKDYARARRVGGCMHCHRAKEVIDDDIKRQGHWTRSMLWRYPPPDNLGLVLEVDRGNVVKRIEADSPAAKLGIKTGDIVKRLNSLPIHSFGDAQYALDRAPSKGSVKITWLRDGRELDASLKLPEGWRKTDITWRTSIQDMLPSARLYGRDLKSDERTKHGLSARQLAFWQKFPVHAQAQAAGVRDGDIILGFDNKQLEINSYDFLGYVRRTYIVGDRVMINILRDGKRLNLPMTLKPF